MSIKIKVGADPELFAIDRNGNATFVHTWLPGTKKEPYKVNGGAVQVDGLAAEFNIDPAETGKEFDEKVKSVLSELTKLKPNGTLLVARPCQAFTSNWYSLTREQLTLGCDPDFDSDGKPLFDKSSENLMNVRKIRTGSGHLHIGWGDDITIDEAHLKDCQMTAMLFEKWNSVIPVHNDDAERRKFYGKPTAHRPKPYGVELRTPSNNWLNYHDGNRSYSWVFNIVKEMMDVISSPRTDNEVLAFAPRNPLLYNNTLAA